MSPETCECCQKPETACDFCGKVFKTDEAYYESKAFRLLEGGPEECGCDSAVLTCERCEVIRMRAARWFTFLTRWFTGARS